MPQVKYRTDTHEGMFHNHNLSEEELEKIKNEEAPKIDWIINDIKRVLAKYTRIRRYYRFTKKILEHPRLNGDLFIGMPVNILPCKEYFGWGSTNIGARGIKVYWYAPEISLSCIASFKAFPSVEATPAGALVHEVEHTLGSEIEFIDPLAAAVGLRFYLTHKDYVTEKWLEFAVNENLWKAVFSIRDNRDKYQQDVAVAIHEADSEFVEEVLSRNLPQQVKEMLESLWK